MNKFLKYYIQIIALCLNSWIFAQNKSTDVQLSNDFIRYSKSLNKSLIVPSPVDFHFGITEKSLKDSTVLPSKYDLRTENLVTPVKNQGGCGGCWNFVVFGAIESNWKKLGFGEFDFSEQNLRTCHGYEMLEDGSCSGGNHLIAAAYLTRRQGPILEQDDIYNTSSTATCNETLKPVTFVDEMILLPYEKNVIKQQIMNYGGVYAHMHWADNSYNSLTKNYYYSGDEIVNHAVLIVGWDDNRTILGNSGAWIAKNSWGTLWGESGYFYISYKDSKILTSAAIYKTVNEFDTTQTLYMYDKLGMTSSIGFGSSTSYGLVKYKAIEKQKLIQFGTYVNSENTELDFYLYSSKKGDRLSNLLCSITGKTVEYPGYYVFDIENPVNLNKDEEFYIKVKYKTPNYDYPIPVEKIISNYATPEIESNVCWISQKGNEWTPLGKSIADGEKDLCIRAYAISDTAKIPATKFSFQIYPNPNNDFLNVYFENSEKIDVQMSIYNIQGKLVHFEEIKSDEYVLNRRIDLSYLAEKGMYIVKINQVSGIYISKFILL